MISDLNGSLGSRRFLDVANQRTCFASCACTFKSHILVRSAFQTSEQPGTLKLHAHDAKHVLSFATLRNCRDPSDPLRSLIILPVPQPMSSTV